VRRIDYTYKIHNYFYKGLLNRDEVFRLTSSEMWFAHRIKKEMKEDSTSKSAN
jgi:hypothetical protein